MPVISNISCYKFATLTDLKTLRENLLAAANERDLKGTILLSTEGINLFVAGERKNVDELVAMIRAIPGLEDLAPKYSDSEEQPFRRMLVRIKKEIIAFGVEGINPALRTSPKLKAAELKQWLDEGKPVTLLDTRNDYEVKLGTFRNALPIGVDTFRDFPDAVRRLPAELKQQPIVMFCTGGIRCEKAGPFMEREGFEHIYQLDGGILKYFEEVGGDHYDGECFVFDQRVGVDAKLHETESTQCFVCQSPLSVREQTDPRYIVNVSCPHCYKTTDEQRAASIAQRQAAIARVTTPLPGSTPYDNDRPLNVPVNADGLTMLEALCVILPHVSREYWLGEFEKNRLLRDDDTPFASSEIVRAGTRVKHRFPNTTEPDVNADIRILHEDEALLIIDKPAPLPIHPGGRFHRNTLQWILHEACWPEKPRIAHRLDADTSGIVVCARTAHFAGRLQPQFAKGEVEKTYLLLVHGHPVQEHFLCDAPIGETTEGAKRRRIDEDSGRSALTEFTVLERKSDGTALLRAVPKTGRTNQIRVHAWHLGHPIVGDRIYLRDGKQDNAEASLPGEPPLCLHSESITFRHPISGEIVRFSSQSRAF